MSSSTVDLVRLQAILDARRLVGYTAEQSGDRAITRIATAKEGGRKNGDGPVGM